MVEERRPVERQGAEHAAGAPLEPAEGQRGEPADMSGLTGTLAGGAAGAAVGALMGPPGAIAGAVAGAFLGGMTAGADDGGDRLSGPDEPTDSR